MIKGQRDRPSENDKNFSAEYARLMEAEAITPDLKEKIIIPSLNSSVDEFDRLKANNVKEADLKEGYIQRRQLLEAGYVFVNRIGGGEKPIINAVIPQEDGSGSIDFGSKVLLTQAELDTVLVYQKRKSEEFGAAGSSFNLIRSDMVAFLESCFAQQGNLRQQTINTFKAAQRRILDNSKYSEDNRDLLRRYFVKLATDSNAASTLNYSMQSCLQGMNLTKVRGVPIEVFNSRLKILQDKPSPFLDSGYHFNINYDVTLFPNDRIKTKRLNMVVVHLLSRGLNEMGQSQNDSHDQRYITSAEFAQDIQGVSDQNDSNNVSEEDLDKIAYRLLARARTLLSEDVK